MINMEKLIFQDYCEEQRIEFMRDNASGIEMVSYTKQLTPDQIIECKDESAEIDCKIEDLIQKKLVFMAELKAELKPAQQRKAELVKLIRHKAEFVEEACYKFIDHDSKMVGYYNTRGELVNCRPIRNDELQMNTLNPFR